MYAHVCVYSDAGCARPRFRLACTHQSCSRLYVPSTLECHRPSPKRATSWASTGRRNTSEPGEQRSRPATDLDFHSLGRYQSHVYCVFVGWQKEYFRSSENRGLVPSAEFRFQTKRIPGISYMHKRLEGRQNIAAPERRSRKADTSFNLERNPGEKTQRPTLLL